MTQRTDSVDQLLHSIKSGTFLDVIHTIDLSKNYESTMDKNLELIRELSYHPDYLNKLFSTSSTVFGVYLLCIAIKCSDANCLKFIQLTWPIVFPNASEKYSEMLQTMLSLEIQQRIQSKQYKWITKILQISSDLFPPRNIQLLVSQSESQISELKYTLQEVKESLKMLESLQNGDLKNKLLELESGLNTQILESSDLLKSLKRYSEQHGLEVKYIDEFHQKFCENSVIKKPLDITRHTLLFKIKSLKTEFTPNLLDTLNYTTVVSTLQLSYISSKYIQMPQPDVGGFEFNLGWVNDISVYLESLTIEDFFILLSFIDSSGICRLCIKPEEFSFYPYFWQLVKIVPELKDITSNAEKYKWLVKNHETLTTETIEKAIDMYTTRVNELILKAPMLDHDMIVWCGDVQEFLQVDTEVPIRTAHDGLECKSTGLIQCTLNPYSAIHELSGERVLKRIRIPKRTHAMYTMNLYSNVIDIVLPIGTMFKVLEQSVIQVQPDVLTSIKSAVCTTGVLIKLTDLEILSQSGQ